MNCSHPAYLIIDGELLCSECREPSPSKIWRAQVYGHTAPEQKAVMVEEIENKGYFPFKRPRGRPRKNLSAN